MSLPEPPLVTILFPIRNEARYIERALRAVLAQTYPSSKLEVIVVDGLSDDGTREIVQRSIAEALTIKVLVLDNPERIVSTALNRGIRAARGQVLIRVDGHAVIAPDYVERCIAALNTVKAECVGGVIQTVGETLVARAIARAQSSPFGVGGARFRYSTRAGYVDTLAFGAYPRRVFERIGLFDEELVRNQDDEFNLRLTRTGGKIWLDPEIRSTYYSRTTLPALWKQYFEYGFWKVRVIQKHGRPASWRHLVPMLLVFALLTAALVSLLTHAWIVFAAVGLGYLIATLVAAAWIAMRDGRYLLLLLPVTFTVMHLGYGVGFTTGIIHLLLHPLPSEDSKNPVPEL